jgi:glucose/mannose transport system permease protein
MRFRLQRFISQLVLSPSVALVAVFLYGFIGWTVAISTTNSKASPRFDQFVGLDQYARLFDTPRWNVAFSNMFLFGFLFLVVTIGLGLLIAILIDQRIRFEGFFRSIVMYPMAMSFVVTGVVWQWLLSPTLGIQPLVNGWGWESFAIDWLVNPSTVIWALVIAAFWQGCGMAMALFLAGLRGVDEDIWKAAAVDGIPAWRVYVYIVVPMLAPVFLTVIVLQSLAIVRAFDLVVALTNGGPGVSSDLPSVFMFDMAFRRANLGLSAASAVVMLGTVLAILVPYLYVESRER